MDALDGNAIAGALFEYFGAEMTDATGSCRHCGTSSRIAEQRVYARAPGVVARCPACAKVTLVIVESRRCLEVNLRGFRLHRS